MEGEEDAGGLRGGCVELHQGAVSRGRGDGVLAFFGGGGFFSFSFGHSVRFSSIAMHIFQDGQVPW